MAQPPSVETMLSNSPGSWAQGYPWDYYFSFPTDERPPWYKQHLFMPASGRAMCANDLEYLRSIIFVWHKGPIHKRNAPNKRSLQNFCAKKKSLSKTLV